MKKRGVRDQMVIATKYTTAFRATFGDKEIIANTQGNGAKSLHLSLQKSFAIWESVSMKFRMDAVNAVNHINPANPGGNIQSDGTITGEAPGPGPRQLVFGLSAKF